MNFYEAMGVLENKIAIPAFFNRLASYGIVPRTEAEAVYYLRKGSRLMKAASRVVEFGVPEHGVPLTKFAQENFNPDWMRDPEILAAARAIVRSL